MRTSKNNYPLLVVTILLLILGILMIYSASYVLSEYRFDDQFYYLKHQLLYVILGMIIMFSFMNIPYIYYQKKANLIIMVCFFLLIIVLIPGIGVVRGGARSWFGIGSFGIQPSEAMKIGLSIFVAKYLAKSAKYKTNLVKGIFPALSVIGLTFLLIMLQPDFGTGMVIVMGLVILLFTAGTPIKYFVYLGVIGMVGIVGLIISAPYRLARIFAFIDPWQDPLGSGFQIIQSLYAIGPGGVFGVGYLNSIQKHFYLPEPQTDFIFAIICEEFGFIGATTVVIMFYILIYQGYKIAVKAPDLFSSFLAISLTSILAVQILLNISVVIGLVPVTGVTLPLISYGGSSLLVTLAMIGILLNINKYIV